MPPIRKYHIIRKYSSRRNVRGNVSDRRGYRVYQYLSAEHETALESSC